MYRTYDLYYLVLRASSDLFAVCLYYCAALTPILLAPRSAGEIGDRHRYPPPAAPKEPTVALPFCCLCKRDISTMQTVGGYGGFVLVLGSYVFGFMTCYVSVGTLCLPATNFVKDSEQLLEAAVEAAKEGGMILPLEGTNERVHPGTLHQCIHLLPSLPISLRQNFSTGSRERRLSRSSDAAHLAKLFQSVPQSLAALSW